MPDDARMFVHSTSVAKRFFSKRQTWSGELSADFYCLLQYLLLRLQNLALFKPVYVVCEAAEVMAIHIIQLLPDEVILRARLFLIEEAQDWIVQDDLACWRITFVVGEKSTFDHLAKIHLEALRRCGNWLGSVDIRVDHLQLALEVEIIGIRLLRDLPLFCLETIVENVSLRLRRAVLHLLQIVRLAGAADLHQRARLFLRILLFCEPSVLKSLLADIWILFEEVGGHWLVLFGFLLQCLQFLLELVKAWLGPQQRRVLPHVGTCDISFLRFGVKVGDQSDLLAAQDRVAHLLPAAVLENIKFRAAFLQPFDLLFLGEKWPGCAAPVVPST